MTVRLILSEEPVTRGLLARMKLSTPNIAVVYSDAFGEIADFGGRPLSWAQQVMSKYRTRYEVDLSDHRRTGRLESTPLPSYGDTYFFQCTVDVGFRVTNPAAVVKRHVTDGLVVIYGYLVDVFRPITRRHEIKDAERAEIAINSMFQNPVTLPEGITIFRCNARLLPDERARAYLQSLDGADRAVKVNTAEHAVALNAARRQEELDEMAHRARLAAEAREHAAMADRPLDLPSLIRAHLARHPDETQYATELLLRHEQAQLNQQNVNDARSTELVRYMMEQGIIQAVDLEILRKQTLNRVQEIASPARPAGLSDTSWDDPLPSGSAPILRLSPESDGGGPAATGGPAVGSAVPVYVVVDESVADHTYFEMLNSGMQTLPSDLAAYPEVISAVRLAILGYAGDVAVRMPLTTVAADSFVPRLTPSDGSRLGTVFDYLYERIPQDVERLKAGGLTVGRPTVHLLSATMTDEPDAWGAQYRRLTDRSSFRYGPEIIACGIGEASPAAIGHIATRPQSAYVADPNTLIKDAVEQYMRFVRASIIALSQGLVSGRSGTVIERPDGFHSAAEFS